MWFCMWAEIRTHASLQVYIKRIYPNFFAGVRGNCIGCKYIMFDKHGHSRFRIYIELSISGWFGGIIDFMLFTLDVPRNPFGHGPLTRYAKLRVAHAPGMPGTFSPPLRKSDPDMHHGTCVTHARTVMHAGVANLRFPLKSVAGKTFPAFPAHAQPAILRIW